MRPGSSKSCAGVDVQILIDFLVHCMSTVMSLYVDPMKFCYCIYDVVSLAESCGNILGSVYGRLGRHPEDP